MSPLAHNQNGPGSNYLILGFFFLTGLTGLAYELVWIRLLILAFGSTQFAVTTVLVTFMAGLALGSLVFGRLIDRFHSPLKVYAAVEVLLGVYCILSPAIFDVVREFYVNISDVAVTAGGEGSAGGAVATAAGFETTQFLLSFAALIVPSTLMGGTLPILVKYLVATSGRVGYHTAVPYAVNTLGAVTGCLATGFVSLYVQGVKATIYAAGLVDIVVGVLVFVIFGSVIIGRADDDEYVYGEHLHEPEPDPNEKPADSALSRRPLNIILLATFGLSGFASLSYEVLWTRVFSLVLGSSVYAFTIMLATFLAGIGAGSILFAPFIDRRKRPLVWFAALEAVIGITALLSIFLYRDLPFIFYSLKQSFGEQFWLFSAIQFLLCALIMIIPTLCMGAIFPLVGRIYSRGLSTVGRHIGDIYFFNTAGSIGGSFIAGFILIPVIGVQNGVILIAGLNLAIAAILMNSAAVGGKARVGFAAALAAVFVIVLATLPPWEKMVMTTGLYVNPVKEEKVERIREGGFDEKLLFYKEGINAVITVRSDQKGEYISYQANGKLEARARPGHPAEAWALLGHIPMLLHPEGVSGGAEDTLVVGLGSGITAGAMEHYPLKEMDVIEIETAVVEAARYFGEFDANNGALSDPRLRLHITDGRSFLFRTDKTYDVIVSAVSDPWITGVSNLFTHEYFTELSDRLAPDGIVSLWFQNYRITPRELKIGLNTFARVFPHVSIWFHYTDTLDLVVIGSKEPHAFDMKRLASAFDDPEIRRGLSSIGIRDPYDVLDLYLIGDTDLRRYIGETTLNTDERPVLEFTLPKNMYLDPGLAVRTMRQILDNVRDVVPPVEVPGDEREEFLMDLGKSYNDYSFRLRQAFEIFRAVVEMNPDNTEARAYLSAIAEELGNGAAERPRR